MSATQVRVVIAVLFTALLACAGCRRDEGRPAVDQPFTVNGLVVEPDSLNAYLAAHRGFTSRGGEMKCAYYPLGQERTRVFVQTICIEFLAVDGKLVEGSGMSVPAAFEIETAGRLARVGRVEIPEDGNRWAPSIRRIFPPSLWEQIFESTGRDRQRGAALHNHLRTEAAVSLGASLSSDVNRSADTLGAAARRVVDFLRGKASFDQINLSDTVTLLVAPEGGGGQATFARQQLRHLSAWRLRSGNHVYSLAPPTGMTNLTTKVGRHFSCNEQSLATRFPALAKLPHVGTLLEPADRSSCLQTWNVTFVFDTSSRPRLVAAVYDQWEW